VASVALRMGMTCVLRPHQLARSEAADKYDTGSGAASGRAAVGRPDTCPSKFLLHKL
jgi:hypothetical protein